MTLQAQRDGSLHGITNLYRSISLSDRHVASIGRPGSSEYVGSTLIVPHCGPWVEHRSRWNRVYPSFKGGAGCEEQDERSSDKQPGARANTKSGHNRLLTSSHAP